MLWCGRVQQCQQLSVEYDICVVTIFIALFSRFRIFQNIDYWHFSPFYSPPFSCSPPLTPKHPDSFIHIVPVLCNLVQASLITWKQSLMRKKYVLCLHMKGRKETSDEYSNHCYEGARCIYVFQCLSHLFWKVHITTKAGMTLSGIIQAFHRLFLCSIIRDSQSNPVDLIFKWGN